ncbi:adenosine deaminase isoform X1 [Megalopta genalis]|uniref:adenosine deaminase isoform X1 n=1 Tax=Megalopta genalis TaxID=115081 RepID=UPI003FD00857
MRIVFLSLVMCLTGASHAMPRIDYKTLREQILKYEQRSMLGANLTLNVVEQAANDILMKEKWKEVEAGFKTPKKFAPGRNFITAKKDIDESEVFQLIRKMPKGAVLHAHDTALASTNYIYNNITFRDNLYVCETNETFKLKFFEEPDEECEWELLKKVRQQPLRATRVNKEIRNRLSMLCDNPAEAYSDLDKAWTKFSDIFEFVHPILTFKPIYDDYFRAVLEQLYEDNVMYLEVRSTLPVLYDFNGTEYSAKDTADLLKNVSERFMKDHPDFVGVKLIYAPKRFVDQRQAEEYIKILKELQELYPNFIAGFDLVGQEDKGKTLLYFSHILENVALDTNFFFHAGETNWYGVSTDENLVDAILLNTKRIGHGYALVNHPVLLEMTRQMNIAIEVNPISNQVLKLVDDMRNHAARRLFAEGYPVVISNDDPSFWDARGLSYDFYEAFVGIMSKHADLKALKQLAINSLVYSSLSAEDKEAALSLWEHKWDNYVNDVAQGGRRTSSTSTDKP